MPIPVTFSVITKQDGLLTKRIYQDESGALVKDASECYLVEGVLEVVKINFEKLDEFLNNLKTNQAIVAGVPKIYVTGSDRRTKYEIVSRQLKEDEPERYKNAITRTLDDIVWPDEGGIMYFDYDPPPDTTPFIGNQLVKRLKNLHWLLRDAAMLWRPSASSCIYLKQGNNKELVQGVTGQRVYVPVSDFTKIKELVQILTNICWFEGLGWFLISKAGTLLPRVLFDTAVFSPERLDFAARAGCTDPVCQIPVESKFYPGIALDTNKTEPISPAHTQAVQGLIKLEKNKYVNQAKEIREEYVKQQTEQLKKHGDVKHPTRTVTSRLSGVLLPDDIIYTNDNEPIKVADLFTNREKYEDMVIRDPIEPDYGKSKAKIFYKSDYEIIINSFAHGGRVYTCIEPSETLDEWLKNTSSDEVLDTGLARLSLLKKADAIRYEQYLSKVAKTVGVRKPVLDKEVKSYEKSEETSVEGVELDDDLEVENSHHGIAMAYLSTQPHELVGCYDMIYRYDGKARWVPVPISTISVEIAGFFGDTYNVCKKRGDYISIARHIYEMKEDEQFFVNAPVSFVTPENRVYIIEDGKVTETAPSPELKTRYKLKTEVDRKNMPEKWLRFLRWAFLRDPDQILVLQEVFGAVIFGMLNKFHKAVLFYGIGSNGKSVVMNVLRSLLPDELVVSVSPYDFTDPCMRAELTDKLLNVVSELPQTQVLSSDNFKAVVDNVLISARRKYGHPYSFVCDAAQVFSSNHLIKTSDMSHGMLRRWLMFEFAQVIKERDKDVRLATKLLHEMPQILGWACEGLERLLAQNNFTLTKSHHKLMNEWKISEDVLEAFLATYSISKVKPPETKPPAVGVKEVYKAYRETAGSMDKRPMPRHKFIDEMKRLGFRVAKKRNKDSFINMLMKII